LRQLTANELLSLSSLLQMETNGLAVAKAGMIAIGDSELKSLMQAGIMATEARIKGFQQFINENAIV
jgi:hypothetical protein